MEPMKPMKGAEPWWPEDLGSPASSGGQNGLRYAFFPEKHRLLVEREGKTTTYDSGDHRISGVQQQSGGTVSFASQNGTVDLDSLKQVG
ncbi:hypothetical protein ACFPYM_11470 [Methylobacterium hispanicum]|nr:MULTISPECIES: hypothetical protein [Methylobacterium]